MRGSFCRPTLLEISLLGYINAVASLYTNIHGTYLEYSAAPYVLIDRYTSENFFSTFGFYTEPDPTHGFVSYQDQATAINSGLAKIINGQIYLGVDHTTVYPSGTGRASVRVTSHKSYNHGLFIADINHMPSAICGVWPAWWLFGPNWPNSGEIDIIEGVNIITTNMVTLHTSPGCNVNTAGSLRGTTLKQADCHAGNGIQGCGTTNTVPNAYGESFNLNGGGIYAMQWESTGIYVWFFPRDHIPPDIIADAPMTGNWGTPIVSFNNDIGCNIDSHFMNQNIVFDTTFCGDWAGAEWPITSCVNMAPSCEAFVSANPHVFAPAYWIIDSVKVYQIPGS